MRKTLFLAAALVSIASCTRVDEVDIPNATMTLLAKTETSAGSRTVVEGETHVYWEPGDEIKVFSEVGDGKFVSTLSAPSATASFNGSLGDGSWVDGMDLWAVYPYAEDATFSDGIFTTTLPSVQIARAGSFGKDMNLAVAHSTDNTLQFYNVGGGVRFTVTEEGVKKVVFEGLNGEVIAGEVEIVFDEDGRPKVQDVASGSTIITLLPPNDQKTFQPNTWYYIVTIPGSLDGGFKLRFYKDSKYARRVSEKAVSIKRSLFGNLENADSGITYTAIMSANPWNAASWKVFEEKIMDIDSFIQPILKGVAKDEDYAANVANAVVDVDGVSAAVPSEDGSIVQLKFTNGAYANIYVENGGDTFGGSFTDSSMESREAYTMQVAEPPTTPAGKKALVLLPVRKEVVAYLGEHADSLYNGIISSLTQCGYEVTSYMDEDARADQYRGDVWDKYHVIYTNTHGSNAAVLPDGTVTSALMTMSSIYDDCKLKPLLAIVFREGDIPRRWVSTEYFKKQKPGFKNSWIFLHACNSMTRGDLPEYFINRGAAACSGFLTEATKRSSVDFAADMVNAMAAGMEVQAASDWTIVHSTNQYGELWTPNLHLDLFVTYRNEGIKSFYIFDPRAYDLGHTICSDSVVLAWKVPPHTESHTSHIYVNNALVGSVHDTGESDYRFAHKVNGPGEYTWFIRTTIRINGEVAMTVQSEEDSFTVRPYSDYPTPEAIDLGLTVRWAGLNLGATRPEEFGDFFAWGEVEPYYSSLTPLVWKPGKGQGYSWDSYRWSKGGADDLTKYCEVAGYGYQGFCDGKTTLELEDDAAYYHLGAHWRIPTRNEVGELLHECTKKRATMNGVEGYVFTGPNGNSIFLPITSHWQGTDLEHNHGIYWSSTLGLTASYFAFGCQVYSNGYGDSQYLRNKGGSIRPVYE